MHCVCLKLLYKSPLSSVSPSLVLVIHRRVEGEQCVQRAASQ